MSDTNKLSIGQKVIAALNESYGAWDSYYADMVQVEVDIAVAEIVHDNERLRNAMSEAIGTLDQRAVDICRQALNPYKHSVHTPTCNSVLIYGKACNCGQSAKHSEEIPGDSTPEQIAAHERMVRQIIKSAKYRVVGAETVSDERAPITLYASHTKTRVGSPYDNGDFGKPGTAEPKAK